MDIASIHLREQARLNYIKRSPRVRSKKRRRPMIHDVRPAGLEDKKKKLVSWLSMPGLTPEQWLQQRQEEAKRRMQLPRPRRKLDSQSLRIRLQRRSLHKSSQKLGPAPQPRPWTNREEGILFRYKIKHYPTPLVARLLDRTEDDVEARFQRLKTSRVQFFRRPPLEPSPGGLPPREMTILSQISSETLGTWLMNQDTPLLIPSPTLGSPESVVHQLFELERSRQSPQRILEQERSNRQQMKEMLRPRGAACQQQHDPKTGLGDSVQNPIILTKGKAKIPFWPSIQCGWTSEF